MLKWSNLSISAISLLFMAFGLTDWSYLIALLLIVFNCYLLANIVYYED